jgi:hypothetical protein
VNGTHKDPRYGLVARDKWASGPWDDEPDRADFVHAGFVCLVLRAANYSGHLNGYVGLPAGHPWHGKDYGDIEAEVHGGLTFASHVERGASSFHFHLPPARADEEYGFHAAILANPLDEVSAGAYADYLRDRDRADEAGLMLESSAYWWVGFDAAHAWDRQPGMEARMAEFGSLLSDAVYRTVGYVADECRSLAKQAARAVETLSS